MTLYLVWGAAFALAAGFSFKRSRFAFIALTTAYALIGVALGLEQNTRNNDSDTGFAVLLFVISPLLAALVVYLLGQLKMERGLQWYLLIFAGAAIGWVVAYALAIAIGLSLNMITI